MCSIHTSADSCEISWCFVSAKNYEKERDTIPVYRARTRDALVGQGNLKVLQWRRGIAQAQVSSKAKVVESSHCWGYSRKLHVDSVMSLYKDLERNNAILLYEHTRTSPATKLTSCRSQGVD